MRGRCGGAGLSDHDHNGVLRHHRADRDAVYQNPERIFPADDSGFVVGSTRASADISFQYMLGLQQRIADIVMIDPAVAALGSIVGGSNGTGGANRGTMFISLKPLAERGGLTTQLVIDRLRRNLGMVPGIRYSCRRPRISASADGKAIPNINTRCRAPISVCCRNGRRWWPSGWRRWRGSPMCRAIAIPADCN